MPTGIDNKAFVPRLSQLSLQGTVRLQAKNCETNRSAKPSLVVDLAKTARLNTLSVVEF
jgi:hypothetical protein